MLICFLFSFEMPSVRLVKKQKLWKKKKKTNYCLMDFWLITFWTVLQLERSNGVFSLSDHNKCLINVPKIICNECDLHMYIYPSCINEIHTSSRIHVQNTPQVIKSKRKKPTDRRKTYFSVTVTRNNLLAKKKKSKSKTHKYSSASIWILSTSTSHCSKKKHKRKERHSTYSHLKCNGKEKEKTVSFFSFLSLFHLFFCFYFFFYTNNNNLFVWYYH